MAIVGIRKYLVFSIQSSWSLVCQHPFVAALLLFMLFLRMYFPASYAFIVYSSPVIACTALLLGALLVYGEADVRETEDLNSVHAFIKVSEKENRSKDFVVLNKGERHISEEDVYYGGAMGSTKVGPFNGVWDEKDDIDLVAGFSSKITEKEIQTEKTVINAVAARDLEFAEKEVFSIENPAYSAPQTVEGLKVEIDKRLDSQFDSSLGSPWQKVNTNAVSSGSESDESEESEEFDGDESLSSDTSTADVVPIIDELHPLLESENLQPVDRSIDASDTASRASSREREFYDDDSAEEETENQEDGEDEEAQEKDNDEAVVKWTADDQKNLMDLGSSELERNQRLENLIAKRRAKKLQRFQTDKNLIDLDIEPFPFMEEISRLNVEVPAISTSRSNPFDFPFDSVESFGLLPVPGSAPSVLLPRRNPFDLPYDQNEESSKLTGESSRPYDGSISQRDHLPRRINNLNLGTVSNAVDQGKHEAKLKPYFVPEKITGTDFAPFESQLSESDSDESSASESDSASAVFNQDYELSKHETHERLLSLNQDDVSFEGESDLSVEVGSSILEQEHNGADSVELEIGETGSCSPVSSTANLEVIDERYGGSSSSSYSEEDKFIETSINIDSLKSFAPIQAVVKPGPPDKEAGLTYDSQVAEPILSGKRDEEADDSQAADPVYDSSPSENSTSQIPSLDVLFSNVKGTAGFSAESSSASDMKANLQVFSTSEEGDSMLRENLPSVLHNYIEVESDQNSVVEKKSNGLNEVSHEVNANLRQRSIDQGSFSGIKIAENLLSDSEIQTSRAKPNKLLDSRMVISYDEKQYELHQNQFPIITSDDAAISVNQHPNNIHGSHDQHSAMEQPVALKSDAGSSSPFDVDLEIKDAELHIPSQQNIALSTSNSADGSSEATGNSPV